MRSTRFLLTLTGALAFAGACGGGADVAIGDGDAYFRSGSIYSADVRELPAAPDSAAITARMEQRHAPNGWGDGVMRIDFSLVVNEASADTEKVRFDPVAEYHVSPDCDDAPVPLPPGGATEHDRNYPPDLDGMSGYECDDFADGGDCHVLVHAPAEQRLYELYHASINPADGRWVAGCLAVWDLTKVADGDGRGDGCTSADAAGYAITPLLVTPEEVASGEIRHALRLVLPDDLIRGDAYYAPATHTTDASGGEQGVPYGARLRLRADYPIETLEPAAQVVARAMQTYGMMLADGGDTSLTFANDLLSSTTWEDVGIREDSLGALKASDFEVVVEGDPRARTSMKCDRSPVDD